MINKVSTAVKEGEQNKKALEEISIDVFERKPNIVGYKMKDGRILNLMAEGRLVNLAAGNGHPAEIMDMSFSLQAQCLEYLIKTEGTLDKRLYSVPTDIDQEVAMLKLKTLGISIDKLSDEQIAYLNKAE